MPIIDKKILDVHKVHILLGYVNSNDLLNDTFKILNKNKFKNEDFYNKITYLNQINDNNSLTFKRILNYYLTIDQKKELLSELMSIYSLENTFNADNYYLTKNEIREMSKNGMIIGGHTHSHPLLSKLSDSQQLHEIRKSLKIDNNTLNTFCFPYGGKVSYNEQTIKILIDLNVEYSFSVNNRDITDFDLQNKILSLPRFDCNYFPHGKIFSY